jgi:AcrR family transcriptional regulator
VENDERTRIFRVMAIAVSDRGVAAVTLAEVAAGAGLSLRKLRGEYANVEECFLAAFEWCSKRAGKEMAQAYRGEHGWVEGVRAALIAMLGLIEREPDLARLWIVYSMGAGPQTLRRRGKAIAALCEYIDRGRLESAVRAEPPAITAEGIVGGLLAILQTRLLAPRLEPPSELLGELMSLILLPYMGSAVAKRELARPGWRPERSRGGRMAVEGVGTRVTYRTARVLRAIAERPGASNREVANRAEVVDQGQISKLLSRLESRGLIANFGGGPGGAPNAWELTPGGEEIAESITSASLSG